jgi:hypothetical protein
LTNRRLLLQICGMDRTIGTAKIVAFDATLAVDEYRHIIAIRDAMTDPSARDEYYRLERIFEHSSAFWVG